MECWLHILCALIVSSNTFFTGQESLADFCIEGTNRNCQSDYINRRVMGGPQ